MNRKLGIVLTVIIIVIGGFVAKLLSNQQEPMKQKPAMPVISNYKFQTIDNKQENFEVKLSGSLKSFNSVDLYAEVTGVAKSVKKEFREGAKFRKGEVLLKIEDSEYKNSVYAQKSAFINTLTALIPDMKYDFPQSVKKWQDYLNAYEMDKELKALPKVSQEKEKYYLTSKNIYNQYYTVKSQEARLAKYTIAAPFDGVISSASINPGTLVRASQLVGSFVNTENYELTVYAGINEVEFLKVGMDVKLTNHDTGKEYPGKISRINQAIDRSSQKVKVYIQVKSDELFDGSYMHASITTKTNKPVTKITSEAVFDKGSVWLNEGGKFKAKNIRIINRIDEFVYVEGLENGKQVLLNPDKNVSEDSPVAANPSQKRNK